MDITIRQLEKDSYRIAQEHGFHDEALDISKKLMLIVDEVSEAHEDHRSKRYETIIRDDGKPEGFFVELADIIIRTLDLACAMGQPLTSVIELKQDYNKSRPHKHGRQF